MASIARHDEDLALAGADLVPPLHLTRPKALPAGKFGQYWGKRATKVDS